MQPPNIEQKPQKKQIKDSNNQILQSEHKVVDLPRVLSVRPAHAQNKRTRGKRSRERLPKPAFNVDDFVWADCGKEGWWPAVVSKQLIDEYYLITYNQEGLQQVGEVKQSKLELFDPKLKTADDVRVEWLHAVQEAKRRWHSLEGSESGQMRRDRELARAHGCFAALCADQLECVVCSREWDDKTEMKTGDVALTVCGHIFCAHCLSEWVSRKQGGRTCPTCRAHVDSWTPFSVTMEEVMSVRGNSTD